MNRRMLYLAAASAAIAATGLLAGRSLGPREAPAAGYARELDSLTAAVGWLDGRAAAARGSWWEPARAASAHLDRAKLTGDYGDYAAAERLLGRAFAAAPEGAGPVMERARLSFTLHRFDRVESDLASAERAILLDDPARAAILGLRADVDFQCGRDEAATRGFLQALHLHPSPQAWARLARAHARSGDRAEAAACYRRALAGEHGRASSRAWIHLQLGLLALESGALGEALEHYARADSTFPGWWLIEEHVAEVKALQGRGSEAKRRYRDLVRRTGNPEFMDALARIERAGGREAEARRWVARAERIYRARLRRFPEATWGHALRHYLEFGDPRVALDLAERNWNLRPNEESRALLEEARRKQAGGRGRQTVARGPAAPGPDGTP